MKNDDSTVAMTAGIVALVSGFGALVPVWFFGLASLRVDRDWRWRRSRRAQGGSPGRCSATRNSRPIGYLVF